MAKASIAAFKTAFKKPIAPITAVGDKLGLDKENAKDGGGDFRKKAAKLHQENPKYFKKLLAYKMAKHWEDDSRYRWMNDSPAEAVESIVGDIIGDAPDAPKMKLAVEQMFDCTAALTKLAKLDNDLLLSSVKQALKDFDPKKADRLMTSLPAAVSQQILKDAFASKDKALMKLSIPNVQHMPKNELEGLATSDPAFFLTDVLKPFNGVSPKGVEMLSDPKMRETLAKAGKTWTDFVENTPMLKFMDGVEKKFKDTDTKADKVGTVFTSLVKNEGIDLTYFTNRLDEDRAILTGMTDKDEEVREKMEELGTECPDKPATQCHNLVGVMTRTVKAVLGDDVTITSGVVKGMALTVKMSTLPGGLLPKSFKGNVVDEDGNPTGQVLFTGNEFGEQSHTWPIIDGVAFDPVLGTKGDAVKAAVANEFKWIVKNETAKGEGGWYFVPAPDLKAPANKHGFGSVYRLTKNPLKFERGIFGLTLNADPDDRPKINDTMGLADGKVYVGDVILEIDGVDTKGSFGSKEALAALNFGEIGETKKLKVRRTEPKKKPKNVKVTLTAFAPSTLP